MPNACRIYGPKPPVAGKRGRPAAAAGICAGAARDLVCQHVLAKGRPTALPGVLYGSAFLLTGCGRFQLECGRVRCSADTYANASHTLALPSVSTRALGTLLMAPVSCGLQAVTTAVRCSGRRCLEMNTCTPSSDAWPGRRTVGAGCCQMPRPILARELHGVCNRGAKHT